MDKEIFIIIFLILFVATPLVKAQLPSSLIGTLKTVEDKLCNLFFGTKCQPEKVSWILKVFLVWIAFYLIIYDIINFATLFRKKTSAKVLTFVILLFMMHIPAKPSPRCQFEAGIATIFCNIFTGWLGRFAYLYIPILVLVGGALYFLTYHLHSWWVKHKVKSVESAAAALTIERAKAAIREAERR